MHENTIDVERIHQIISDVETKKEASFINAEEKRSFSFENKMPPAIGEHLESTYGNISDDEIDEICAIANDLSKGLDL